MKKLAYGCLCENVSAWLTQWQQHNVTASIIKFPSLQANEIGCVKIWIGNSAKFQIKGLGALTSLIQMWFCIRTAFIRILYKFHFIGSDYQNMYDLKYVTYNISFGNQFSYIYFYLCTL